jgi:hypothetical protein
MRLRAIAAVVLGGLITAASAPARADAPSATIIVRVYETLSVTSHVKAESFVVASAALAPVVRVVWKDCSVLRSNPACEAPPRGDFILRLVQSPPRQSQRHRESPLGDTFVDMLTRQAVLATVYVDRVERVSTAARFDPGTLLGYAVAHEIGHLLLASTSHSTTGLMRPIWRDDELQERNPKHWRLTSVDAAAMTRRLVPPRAPVPGSQPH